MSKIKICVYVKNYDYNGDALIEINHKRPKNYMLCWNFKTLLNYIKKECYLQDIYINNVFCIVLCDNDGYWYHSVPRPVLF